MSKWKLFVEHVREGMGVEAQSPEMMLDADSKKDQVINAIIKRGVEVEEKDLPGIMSEMKLYFEAYKNGDYFTDLDSKDYCYNNLHCGKKQKNAGITLR